MSPLFVKVVLENSSQKSKPHILATWQPWLTLLCVCESFLTIRLGWFMGSPIQTNAFFIYIYSSSSSFGASANMMRPHVMLNMTLWFSLKKIRFSTPKKKNFKKMKWRNATHNNSLNFWLSLTKKKRKDNHKN